MNNNEPLSLYALNNIVRNVLAENMPARYWVVAELSEVRETAAGHCYIELVQRDEDTNEMLAKARGTIWSRVYTLLRPYFLQQTGQPFAVGLKVLLQVTIGFHELYGFALDVCDVEPSYTIGDMARRRQLIINRLADEGVINLNRELPFPQLPQRIAVISSSFAAGYGDFCHQLQNNPYGFVFYPHLFASPMQGAKVEQGIIDALNSIAANIDCWDLVVIIRGGGATSELSCFDTYDLANNCAQFPLPIVTGIGHQRDDTVLDIVAHTRAKTPTAAAELLIHTMAQQAAIIDDFKQKVVSAVVNRMESARMHLSFTVRQLPVAAKLCLQKHYHRLELFEAEVKAASPRRILSLGYSLTTCNGVVVRSVDDVEPGAEVVTHIADGKFTSTINNSIMHENKE